MSNLHDIFGLACPNCEQSEALCIAISCMSHVTPDGSEPYGDHDWDDAAFCCCELCGHSATVADFTVQRSSAPVSEDAVAEGGG
jgi:hypothetical protein